MRPYIKLFVASLPLVLLAVLFLLLGAYGTALYYTTHGNTVAPATTTTKAQGVAAVVLPDNVVNLETSEDNDGNCLALVLGRNGEPDYIVRPCPNPTRGPLQRQ
jgi:hypothetical protein